MELIVRGQNVPISAALEAHSRERIERAVRLFEPRIERVVLVFVDLDGPRKGLGQACKAFVALASGDTLVQESRDRDFYTALSHVAHRVRHQLLRLHERAAKPDYARASPLEVA